jgi:hypothetical protein
MVSGRLCNIVLGMTESKQHGPVVRISLNYSTLAHPAQFTRKYKRGARNIWTHCATIAGICLNCTSAAKMTI